MNSSTFSLVSFSTVWVRNELQTALAVDLEFKTDSQIKRATFLKSERRQSLG